jgi:hypothetical protein
MGWAMIDIWKLEPPMFEVMRVTACQGVIEGPPAARRNSAGIAVRRTAGLGFRGCRGPRHPDLWRSTRGLPDRRWVGRDGGEAGWLGRAGEASRSWRRRSLRGGGGG